MNLKPLTAALLAALLLTGCRKGDGTENRTPTKENAPIITDAYAEEKDAMFTDVTVDENAKGDLPFAFDTSAVEKPQQDIVLALLYEKFNGAKKEQTVNYYDADGNVYRYRQPLDLNGDWYSVLHDAWKNGATVVNKMSDAERQTLWYLAAHTADYEALELKKQVTHTGVSGTYWLYLIKPDGEPMLLAVYEKTAQYRDSAEVTAFLNWFRYFFHGDFKFGK